MPHIKGITINTDASFNPDKKVGGYAFVIVCDLFRFRKSGKFKKQPNGAHEAELMCIANAIYVLLHQKELPTVDWIILNGDCIPAFESIKAHSGNKIGKKIYTMIGELRRRTRAQGRPLPTFEKRHVKAHTKKQDARSIVNEWCDIEAKKQMRELAKSKR